MITLNISYLTRKASNVLEEATTKAVTLVTAVGGATTVQTASVVTRVSMPNHVVVDSTTPAVKVRVTRRGTLTETNPIVLKIVVLAVLVLIMGVLAVFKTTTTMHTLTKKVTDNIHLSPHQNFQVETQPAASGQLAVGVL